MSINIHTIITIIVTSGDGNNWVKIGYTQLMRKHKDDLLGGEWLNDSHIHAVQQLTRSPTGLQSPILGQS